MRVLFFSLFFLVLSWPLALVYAQQDSITIANEKAKQFWHSNMDSAKYYAETAYKLSFGSSNWQEVARAKANKGIVHYTESKYQQAISFYDSAIVLAKNHSIPYAKFLVYKASALRRLSYYQKSISFLENELSGIRFDNDYYHDLQLALLSSLLEIGHIKKAKPLMEQIENDLDQQSSFNANFALLKSKYLAIVAQYEKSDSISYKLLTHFDSIGEAVSKAEAYLRLGHNAMAVSQYDTSYYYLNEASELQKKENYAFGIAEVNLSLGGLYSYLGEYQIASDYLFEALKTFQANNNRNEMQKVYYELGWIYYARNIYDKALDYLNKAITIADDIGNYQSLGNTYNALGNTYFDLENYQEALKNYLNASEYHEQINSIKSYAASKFNAALVYEKLGLKQKALAIYKETYQIDVELNNLRGMAIGEYTLAEFYLNNNNLKEARYYIELSVDRLKKLAIPDQLSYAYQVAANIYEALNDYVKANNYLKQNQKLQKQILESEQESKIEELEAQYNLRNMEQKINMLNLEQEHSDKTIELSEKTIKNQRRLITVAILAVILLIISLYISYRFINIRSRSNKKLKQLNIEIKEKQEEILAQSEELQEANAQISEMNSYLEKRVEERSQELLKAQHELDTFFYKASHDFRGPLTTFMGIAEVANISIRDKEALQLFDRVKVTAKKLDKMVKKLQSISSLQHDSSESIEIETINVNVLFNELDKDFTSLIKETGVHLQFSSNIDIIQINKSYLKLCMESLIENGIIYNHHHSPFVKVEITNEHGTLLVKVEDNGKGIPAKHQEQIFHMFHRTSTESLGNGLGLFLVQKIATFLKGKIEVASTVGQGSLFTLYLPESKKN